MVRDWSWMAEELDYPDSWERDEPPEPTLILPPAMPVEPEFLADEDVVSEPSPAESSGTWDAILQTVVDTVRPVKGE